MQYSIAIAYRRPVLGQRQSRMHTVTHRNREVTKRDMKNQIFFLGEHASDPLDHGKLSPLVYNHSCALCSQPPTTKHLLKPLASLHITYMQLLLYCTSLLLCTITQLQGRMPDSDGGHDHRHDAKLVSISSTVNTTMSWESWNLTCMLLCWRAIVL